MINANKDIDNRHAEGYHKLGSLGWRSQASSMKHAAIVPPPLWNIHVKIIANEDCMNNLNQAFNQLVGHLSIWVVLIKSLQQDQSMDSLMLLQNASGNAPVKLIDVVLQISLNAIGHSIRYGM